MLRKYVTVQVSNNNINNYDNCFIIKIKVIDS